MKLSIAVVVLGMCIFSVIAVPIYAQEEDIVVPIGERQLFLDDYVIAELNNLTRTMHHAVKKEAVTTFDREVAGVILQTRSAPCWDPEAQVFKLVLTETALPREQCFSKIFESKDGLHWSEGEKANMIFYMMVYDGTDPDPARRYKSFFHEGNMLYPIVSPDAVTWTMLDVPPIPSFDEQNFSFDEKAHLFIATVKRDGPYGRSHALVTSTDFEHWTDHGVLFHTDELDQELGRENIKAHLADPELQQRPSGSRQPFVDEPIYSVDIYNMAVFRYEGYYLGMPSMHHRYITRDVGGGDDTIGRQVQLACSRDLLNWTRLGDRQAFIGPSGLRGGMPPSNAVVRTGEGSFSGKDELWFYTGAISLAVLRRDGFISLDAGEEAGSIITKPLRIPEGAQRLFVNVDAPQGELRAAILDASGRPVEGFAVDQCVPITGDQPRAEVTWEGHPNLWSLAAQDLQIRFSLKNGSLYAFWFE